MGSEDIFELLSLWPFLFLFLFYWETTNFKSYQLIELIKFLFIGNQYNPIHVMVVTYEADKQSPLIKN